MKYRPEIDGLRAVAVLPVVLFHAGFVVFGGGFVGVDIFFVISGYLITTIIRDEIAAGKFTIARFYERRARRILPAMFTIVAACIPFAWFWMMPDQLKDFAQSLIGVVTFSSNVLFWLESGYFERVAELKPLLHTWSLSVEEQFYVFFPLMMLLLRKRSSRTTLAVVAAITILSLAGAVYGARVDPVATFYLIPTRAWELGAGALLAIAGAKRVFAMGAIRELAAFLGLALVGYSMFAFDESTPFPSAYTLVPVIGTTLLIGAADSSSVVGRVLAFRPLVFVGLISYSLYLWHQPVFALLRLHSLYEPSAVAMGGAIALAFALAVLTWKFVEAPFRKGETISRRTLVVSAVAAAAVVFGVGLAGHLANGFVNDRGGAADLADLQARTRGNYGLSEACQGLEPPSAPCRTGNTPTVLVWGDSYAMHLVEGLRERLPSAGIVQATKSVCGPILGIAPILAKYPEQWARGCLEFNDRVFDWAAHTGSLKVAILSSPFSQYLDPRNSFLTADGETLRADFDLALERFNATLDELVRLGIRPIVVSPPPAFGGDVGQCLTKAKFFGMNLSNCDFSRAEADRFHADVARFLKAVESRHKVVWLDEVMCDSTRCLASAQDVLIYRDTGHLSYEGSRYVMGLIDLPSLLTGVEIVGSR